MSHVEHSLGHTALIVLNQTFVCGSAYKAVDHLCGDFLFLFVSHQTCHKGAAGVYDYDDRVQNNGKNLEYRSYEQGYGLIPGHCYVLRSHLAENQDKECQYSSHISYIIVSPHLDGAVCDKSREVYIHNVVADQDCGDENVLLLVELLKDFSPVAAIFCQVIHLKRRKRRECSLAS